MIWQKAHYFTRIFCNYLELHRWFPICDSLEIFRCSQFQEVCRAVNNYYTHLKKRVKFQRNSVKKLYILRLQVKVFYVCCFKAKLVSAEIDKQKTHRRMSNTITISSLLMSKKHFVCSVWDLHMEVLKTWQIYYISAMSISTVQI